jgi:hypothetical protein
VADCRRWHCGAGLHDAKVKEKTKMATKIRYLLLLLTITACLVSTAEAQLIAKPDSLCLSVFIGDSLNNPANLVADTFVVVVMSPGGDSIMAISGPPATAGLNVDSLALKTLGRTYHWAKKVDDIDAIVMNGLYEVRFCAKRNSPLLVTCQVLHFQIIDSTLNTLFYGATVADIVKETQRRMATLGNLLENSSFEDTITAASYNFWTAAKVGTGDARFSSLMSTFGAAGYYSARLYTNASGDSASFLSMPILISTPGAYAYGGYVNQTGLHAGDSAVIGLVTNNTLTYIDSLPLGPLATGTIHWYRFERKVYLPAGQYQMIMLNKYRTPSTTVYFDDVYLRRIPTDSAGTVTWSTAQRDTLLAQTRRVLDSLKIQITNWSTANRDTLLNRSFAALDSLNRLLDSIYVSQNMLANIGLYNGSLYDTTGVILYPIGIAPKDSARVYQITAAMATWTYRGSFYYKNVGVTTRTTNVTDTIIFKRD